MGTEMTFPRLAAIRVAPADTVAVALTDLPADETLDIAGHAVRARAFIPAGHKIALAAIAAGAQVVKFGAPIGRATQAIEPGEHVHSHNLATALKPGEKFSYTPAEPRQAGTAPAEFLGYRRADKRVGTRNEIWIIPTVGCVARTSERLARDASRRFAGAADRIHALTHPFGCSQLGDDLNDTRRILAALASHPNAGGALIVGLGCESNKLNALLDTLPDRTRIRAIAAQDAGDEHAAGMDALGDLAALMANDIRTPCPASALSIGLKCGGSDGFSGLSANPLLGRVADRVTDLGGAALLTEIPEIFGAENTLLRRAANRDVFERAVDVIDGFKRYFVAHNQPIYANPSPGNIAGGITTLEEKSLGAVQKSGLAPLTDVLSYGERIRAAGLSLLEAPGNDAVSSTALTAAGANVILFTTGRGTPLGFPAPTLKVASNSELAQRKPHWIDFDAGVLLDGADPNDAAARLFQLVLDTASGQPCKAEQNGEREIAIWKRGVTL